MLHAAAQQQQRLWRTTCVRSLASRRPTENDKARGEAGRDEDYDDDDDDNDDDDDDEHNGSDGESNDE